MMEYLLIVILAYGIGFWSAFVVIKGPNEREMISRIKRLRREARLLQEVDMSVMKDLEGL